jgi:hypothetical protein
VVPPALAPMIKTPDKAGSSALAEVAIRKASAGVNHRVILASWRPAGWRAWRQIMVSVPQASLTWCFLSSFSADIAGSTFYRKLFPVMPRGVGGRHEGQGPVRRLSGGSPMLASTLICSFRFECRPRSSWP